MPHVVLHVTVVSTEGNISPAFYPVQFRYIPDVTAFPLFSPHCSKLLDQ